ncbi:sn-glycerol-3-phosphate-binding periplasmic protein UgpB precursor [Pseudovibrio sp. Ad46]|uniref:ABC transporter substrate-binding protein n=1 Tax=unclassified Pseudovibrio TaxID=2627060 RepID=UPI0007AEE1A9|nr:MULTISPECIES: sugar ABC transporter substrate-binding protein [unclassified Pseudovibrio]KZK94638.1 sn-glycerol-3-phosphate-binding periplasmic protein UgpB precursor [Pseudovibrio sp. Ad46]KZL01523.1 sn-glycerol-3-phosphate-binding periplasmic protein UgpB precursor [Pseudovibrio sp. Ad5]KZL24585.1 sn-glycerol-3-phosphate-binding periplasmic protein UgpB precursor [Pseudovibrio sp. WM33]
MKKRLKQLAMVTAVTSMALGGASAAFAEEVLRFATWNSSENLAILQEISKRFEAANPGVKVQVESYGDGYDKKLIAAFGAGNPPDVMYMWNYPKYYKSLMPLDELMARDAESMDLEDIPAGLINTTRIEGKAYGIPAGFTTHVVFYNKDMFEAAGVAEPKTGWTWSDLREKAAQFRDKGSKTYGFAVEAKPDPYDYEQFFWSNGTRFIAEDGSSVDGYMNSPEAVEVLTMFAEMAKNEEATVLGIGDSTSGSALFKGSKLAMFQSAMWSKGGIDKAGINYGVAMLPAFGDKPVHSSIGASAMSVAKATKNPELAWEFVKFYASPEAVKLRENDLPIRTSVAEEMNLTADPIYKPFFEMLALSDRESNAFLKHKNWSKIQTNLERAIEATMIEKGNAKKHLDSAVARSKRHLK